MADKEERITIHQVLYPCKKCSIKCNKNDWKDCDFYQNYISGISRAEAVERMAKAMFKKFISCHNCRNKNNKVECKKFIKGNLYLFYAEAALDALLEGK